MSGYTPVFDSVFQGTLCGKYPDLPVWLVLLALQQRGGIIDAHPSYIATVSGLPQSDIELAIKHFCEPDPASRTPDNDGRRLVPLDGRGFGWRVVNHDRYREKARKQAYDDQRTASGADAERKRLSRAVPTSPDESRALPLSEAEAEAEAEKNKNYVPTERCPAERDRDAVNRVFVHWQTVHQHPRAKLDGKRRRIIRAALANYTADDLCESIGGYLNSPHHMGQNDRSTRYDDIEIFLRDAKHIDAGLAFARHPPSNLSQLTRQNLANTDDWVPPEMRRAAN